MSEYHSYSIWLLRKRAPRRPRGRKSKINVERERDREGMEKGREGDER